MSCYINIVIFLPSFAELLNRFQRNGVSSYYLDFGECNFENNGTVVTIINACARARACNS